MTKMASSKMCPRWELNPRPMAHKTIALTTELRGQEGFGNDVMLRVGFEPTR